MSKRSKDTARTEVLSGAEETAAIIAEIKDDERFASVVDVRHGRGKWGYVLRVSIEGSEQYARAIANDVRTAIEKASGRVSHIGFRWGTTGDNGASFICNRKTTVTPNVTCARRADTRKASEADNDGFGSHTADTGEEPEHTGADKDTENEAAA